MTKVYLRKHTLVITSWKTFSAMKVLATLNYGNAGAIKSEKERGINWSSHYMFLLLYRSRSSLSQVYKKQLYVYTSVHSNQKNGSHRT